MSRLLNRLSMKFNPQAFQLSPRSSTLIPRLSIFIPRSSIRSQPQKNSETLASLKDQARARIKQRRAEFDAVPSTPFQRLISLPFAAYLLLVFPAACIGMALWQVQRLRWKLNLITTMEGKMAKPPVTFPEDLKQLRHMEYEAVEVVGTFLHDREFYIGHRSPKEADASLKSHAPTGFHVVTPFKLVDRDLTILINRGWVEAKFREPHTRPEGQVKGVVKVTGVVRHTDTQQFRNYGCVDDVKRLWAYRDVEEMSDKYDTDSVFLDARIDNVEDFETTLGNHAPIGSQTRVSMRNEHLQYVLTWLALAGGMLAMWVRRYVVPKQIDTLRSRVQRIQAQHVKNVERGG